MVYDSGRRISKWHDVYYAFRVIEIRRSGRFLQLAPDVLKIKNV